MLRLRKAGLSFREKVALGADLIESRFPEDAECAAVRAARDPRLAPAERRLAEAIHREVVHRHRVKVGLAKGRPPRSQAETRA